jgi:hypothetical protein
LKVPATWLRVRAEALVTGELSYVLSFAIAAVLIAYGAGAGEFVQVSVAACHGSKARAARPLLWPALTVATIRAAVAGRRCRRGAVNFRLVGADGIGFFRHWAFRPAGFLDASQTLLLGIEQVPRWPW